MICSRWPTRAAWRGWRARPGRSSGRATCRAIAAWRSTRNAVYVSTADGDVVRLDRANGTEQWTQKALARRQLTAPVSIGGRVVVADAGGVVHWLDAATGDFVARARSANRSAATASPPRASRSRSASAARRSWPAICCWCSPTTASSAPCAVPPRGTARGRRHAAARRAAVGGCHAADRRHRRPAERRQVDAVQCADAQPRGHRRRRARRHARSPVRLLARRRTCPAC